ncbi:MAG: hypothetical protein Q9166_001963 [cf. Caloplaca sp. 2 TL-2023]
MGAFFSSEKRSHSRWAERAERDHHVAMVLAQRITSMYDYNQHLAEEGAQYYNYGQAIHRQNPHLYDYSQRGQQSSLPPYVQTYESALREEQHRARRHNEARRQELQRDRAIRHDRAIRWQRAIQRKRQDRALRQQHDVRQRQEYARQHEAVRKQAYGAYNHSYPPHQCHVRSGPRNRRNQTQYAGYPPGSSPSSSYSPPPVRRQPTRNGAVPAQKTGPSRGFEEKERKNEGKAKNGW